MKIPIHLALLALSASIAQAADASFDIQTGSNTQTGFTAVTSFPVSDGTVTLSLDIPPSGFRDRGITAPIDGHPDADILRDLAFWSTTNPITFTFSGLQANTDYGVLGWVFDSESGNNGKNIDFTTNGGTVSITTSNTSNNNSAFSIPNLTTDGSGTATIVMDHTGGAGGAVSFVNGFQLSIASAPSPDPKITSFSVSGSTATVVMTGAPSTDYYCAGSAGLTGWTTEIVPASPPGSPFQTDANGDFTFTIDTSLLPSAYFFRVQDTDPSP